MVAMLSWMGRRVAMIGVVTLPLAGLAGPLSPQPTPALAVAPGITATKSLYKVNGGTPGASVKPGDTLTYKVIISNAVDSADATGVTFNDTPDSHTTITGTTGASPIALDHSYPVTGNLSIAVPQASGVLAGDYQGLGSTTSITAPTVGTATATSHGTVTVAANGSFTYEPNAGYVGSDSFGYTIANATGSDSGTVTLSVSHMVWFINNATGACSSSCDGRFSHPYTSLSSFISANKDSTGDSIFIYQGSGSYSGALSLKSNERLIGQGDDLNATTLGFTPAANGPTLPSATGKPTLSSTLTLATGVTVLALDLSTGSSTGLLGTTGSGITVGDSPNTSTNGVTVTTTTGTAVSLSNLGGAFTFRSVSANGGANGISLSSTTGSFTVTGDGTNANNASGGTIQNTTAHGLSLTNAQNISLNQMDIQSTADSGVSGTQVVNFAFTNGTINNSGTGSAPVDDRSNIGFGFQSTVDENNVSGVVTITGNTLTNAYGHGVDIQNYAGTITNATISNNTLTSSTVSANTNGSGIRLLGFGYTGGVSNITKATISGNTITNFSGGAGITAQYGNSTSGPAGTWGTPGDATNVILIQNNSISGQSDANPMGANAVLGTLFGKGQANWKIDSNGTAANPISHVCGTAIGIGVQGANSVATARITNNHILGMTCAGAGAISMDATYQTASTDAPHLTGTVSGNTVSGQDGNGIIILAGSNSNAIVDAAVLNNNVGAPNCGGCNRFGILADSGSANVTASGVAPNLCLNLSGNTAAGSGVDTGIGIRKKDATYAFGVLNLPAGDTATPNFESYINSQNPAGNGTTLVSQTSGFTDCSTAPASLLLASGGITAAKRDRGTTFSPRAPGVHGPPGSVPSLPLIAPRGGMARSLDQGRLAAVVAAAAERWVAAGITPSQLTLLKHTLFTVAHLGGSYLGQEYRGHVTLDNTAGGNGWYIDTNPGGSAIFDHAVSPTRSHTDPTSAAAGHVDLLTTVMHEMGHALGLGDLYAPNDRDDLMYGYVTTGERRLPRYGEATGAVPSSQSSHPDFALTPVSIGTLPAGKSVTITFDVQVNDPPNLDTADLAGGAHISNTGQVSGTNFTTVNTNTLTTPVQLYTPSVSLGTSGSPSLQGQQVTFTATVAHGAGTTTTPSGTVTFTDTTTSTTLCSTVSLANNGGQMQATCQTSSLTHGTHSITAHYNGDGNFQTGDSNTVTQTITIPDLTMTKSNDVGGTGTLGSPWNWTLAVANGGDGAAVFSSGAVILEDDLPTSGLTYGTATVTSPTGISGAGTISCAIDATTKILTCVASGGPVVIAASTGAFNVVFSATSASGGSFVNPQPPAGICRVNPGPSPIAESNTSNNDCTANTVTVSAPDLTVTKSNSVSGATTFNTGWTWKLHVANGGTGSATFAGGQTILSDDLPSSGLTYAVPGTANQSSISGNGTISCSITSNTLSCVASGGTVIIGAGGSVDVSVAVTPTAAGSYANPRAGGSCGADPNNAVAESNESNNSCNTDTVTVSKAGVTVALGTSGSPSTLGSPVTFTVTVSPVGATVQPSGTVTFTDTTTSTALCSNVTLTNNGGQMQATCPTSTLSAGSHSISAHYNGDGNFLTGDSNSVSQVVNAPDLTVSKSNGVGGSTTFNTGWTWTLHVANGGSAAATFTSGQTILSDDLPSSGLTYGTPATANPASISGTGTISCSIASNTLSCTASGGTVIIGTGGSVDVTVQVTPTAAGSYANPPTGGSCSVDPSNAVTESNEANNSCNVDSVTVSKAGVSVTLGTSGSPSPFGQQVTFTATVSPVGTTVQPSGTVTFTDTTTSTTLCTTVNLANNGGQMQATCQTSTLGHGTHSITAHYNGDGNFTAGDPAGPTSQVVTSPHLTLVKSNDVNNAVGLGTGWSWTLTASNTGDAAATFTSGQTILQDDLPSSGLNYGTLTVPLGSQTNITGGANISCRIDVGTKTLTCTASGGSITMGPTTGVFTVLIPVTPTGAGSYANPRTSGTCQIDPGGLIAESDTSGKSCSNTVSVGKASVTIALGTSGSPSLFGQPVTFSAAVSPVGTSTQPSGTVTFTDTTANTVLCAAAPLSLISAQMVATCQTSTLVHGTNSISAHYTGDTNFAAGGDPATPLSQVVTSPHLTLAQVDNVSGYTNFPGGWNWQLAASNIGDGGATFAAGQTILQDDLPNSGLTYGTVTVPAVAMTGITGGANISCSIDGSQTLACKAAGGPVTMAAGSGSFGLVIPVSPTAGGSYTNPRSPGGICRIDPASVIPQSDRSGSDCAADTVTVANNPTISASPNPVPNGSSLTTISWNTGTGSSGQVYVAVDGGIDQAFASGATSALPAPWITAGHVYLFKLYAGTSHTTLLGTVMVTAAGTPAITASPNPVPGGASTSTISWTTGNSTSGQIYVAVDGGADQTTPFASGASGAVPAAFITSGHVYQFKLYAGTSHSTLLGAVTVTAAGTPAITASPNPVPGGSQSSLITWTTGDGSSGQVYVAVDGGADQLFISGANGAVIAPWIMPGYTYVFKLYAGSSHTTLLGTVTVGAAGTPLLSASPDPVPGGSSNSTITWSTEDGTAGQVYVSVDGGADQLFASGASGMAVAPWITSGHTYLFKLYAGSGHANQLAAVIVTGVGASSPAVITASPNPVTGATANSTVIWSTGDGTSGQVYVAVDGGADQLMISGASGVVIAPWISHGHSYVFKLYAGTAHTTLLSSVTVTHS